MNFYNYNHPQFIPRLKPVGFLAENFVKLFQYLIDDGCVWNLEGFYRRTAEDFIRGGYCTLSYKETIGCYMWGSPKLPKKFDLEPGLPGTDEYVQKRKEMGDDEFFEWSNLKISEIDE